MDEDVIIVDVSEIREGRLSRVDEGMKQLVEFAEANEPRMAAYAVYLDRIHRHMTVLQIHPDSASAEFHLDAAGHLFEQFRELLTLSRIDVYGMPSQTLLGRLRQKAEMLGGAPVEVHDLRVGFVR